MDWDDLAYFISLVEEQTLTACAEKLEVQHSTVSRRIERLEKALSLQLFDRIGKRYTLTQEGETLYVQAVTVQNEIFNFKRMAIDQTSMQGKVIVSAPPVLANELLIPRLPDFHEKHPDIILQLGGDLQFVDLHRKEADIALRLGRPKQNDLLIRTISQVRYGFFAHQTYVDSTPVSDWVLIEFNANKKLRVWLQCLIDRYDYSIVFSSNDLYVVNSTVSQAMGIAILPYFLALNNPNLVPINPIDRRVMTEEDIISASGNQFDDNILQPDLIPLIQSQPLYTVIHPDVRRSARVNGVAEWLGGIFEKQ